MRRPSHSMNLTQVWYSLIFNSGSGHIWEAAFRSMPRWHSSVPFRLLVVSLRVRCALSAKEPERWSVKSLTQERQKLSEATIIPLPKGRQNLVNGWVTWVASNVGCELVVTRGTNKMLNLGIVKFIFYNIAKPKQPLLKAKHAQ